METKTNPVVFFDAVGRTIIGEKIENESNEKNLAIKNPAVIHISPNQQTGQLTLQILPLFFKEFLADKSAPTVWIYKKDHITEAKDIVFDFKLQAQYQQIFASTPPESSEPQKSGDIVKLFDDE
jgi:hypothetical protein